MDRPWRLTDALLAAGVGLFCSWAVLQSLGNYSGWLLAPWLIVVIILGGVLWPVALSRTGIPQRLARPSAEFWGGGGATRAIGGGSLYACASIAWGVALVLLFGGHPEGQ
jgi:hypothetical protein